VRSKAESKTEATEAPTKKQEKLTPEAEGLLRALEAGAYTRPRTGPRANAWCLLPHAEASLPLAKLVHFSAKPEP